MTQTTVFHPGELLVQDRAGLSDDAQRVGRIVQASIAPGAQAFLLDQRMAIVGGADPEGQVWASALFGAPGFLTALDDRTVRIAARPGPGDPLAEVVGSGARAGMLVIELASRRRMRVNGTVVSVEPDAFTIAASEVFGNCQKYIQRRVFEDADGVSTDAPTSWAGRELSEGQRAWIAQADTFFIASLHAERGADVSHRGGLPGFVRVISPTMLVFPDYVGNAMFQTLGNLATHPEAGLLFVDFGGGRTLHLTGRAEILWDDAAERYAPETRRAVRFEIAAVRELAGRAIPPSHLVEYSPFNPAIASGE